MKEQKFSIAHIDPLGQGVSKIDDQIIFIPKTLPNESGTCEILRTKKKVAFAKVAKIDEHSPLRQKSDCPVFENCPGCHYLHTGYNNEVLFKKNALLRHFIPLSRELKVDDIIFIEAAERYHYRNRIQLHYDLEADTLGYLNVMEESVVSAKDCLLPTKAIEVELKNLYQNWKSIIPKDAKTEGHIELYERNGKVSISFNKPYAEGGFTQVNQEMNEKMIELVKEMLATRSGAALDLFGGSGNLTAQSPHLETLVVDATEEKHIKTKEHQTYKRINLYGKNAPKQVSSLVTKKPDVVIFDPPRSGVKNIKDFVNELKGPEFIIYIGCECPNLVRDLVTITDQYALDKIYIVDLFPGTRHFETIVTLKRL
ncbi:tRNA (Uracil-5-)-methyltransferase domain protein [Bacteriovorax sp. BSW11_IV]|uniref:class I SAM-dependent RNA methyltransferase n=1 Tax=Bacteriovorax sp. BSW11_IV TaxID=1353529 RepID=UPI00038A3E51|nr:class I SAM-dependent RNA methyltransferase [Bacteriovorax sp. BSW11_IV]EQC45872.1 tRNA (Uracil-5-)-methyltransferase domain protein [Bacteriovorax sp. BSW11_IV]